MANDGTLQQHQKLLRAVLSLRPGAQLSLNGDTYESLNWLDQAQTKPTAAEVSAELARLQAADAVEFQREVSIRADPGRADLLNRLKTATPAQIEAYVDANVTNIAGAKAMLKLILKVIALDRRS